MGLLTKAVTTIARGLGLTSPELASFYAGGPTNAGPNVTVDTALTLDTVWACVKLISQTIGTLPFQMYQRTGKGRSIVAPEHPLYRLIHDQPNAEMTATEFWEAMTACTLLWGNSYAEKVLGLNGRIIALVPMRPDRVTVRRQYDGSLTYTYSWLGIVRDLGEDQVLHIKGFSLDGQMGISVIGQARQSLGSVLAAEQSAASIFRNGMRPSGYLKSPTYLSDPQREQAKGLLERFKGATNTGGVPLLEGGWDFTSLSIPPEDAQLLETRGFHVEQVCRWFDMPPIMIGHMEKSTAWGSGLEQMNLWFLTYCLRHHLKRIEQAVARSLLLPAERDKYFAEFNVEGLMRADSKGRAELYKTYIDHGIATPNEVRAIENLPPIAGGDELIVNSAMLPISLLGQVAKLPTEKPVDPGFVPPSGTQKDTQNAA